MATGSVATDATVTGEEEHAPPPQHGEPSSAEKKHAAAKTEEPSLAARTSLAVDEGHDADIPSSIGYVLDEAGESKRRASIARRRRESDARMHPAGDVEKNAVDDTKSDEDDPNVVFWDGPDDPANPYNWPAWRVVVNCGLISTLTFVTPLASSIFAPGVPQLMAEFGSDSPYLAAFVVSVYVLGFAAGPLMFAPLSEMYGRTVIYHVCNVGFLAFCIGCALAPTLDALIVFRFFSGVFGACPLTNGGGSIADMVAQEKRGAAMSIFSIGPLLGPIIGPVAGGFLAAAKGWRWVFWLLVILSGTISVAMLLFLKESYAPLLLERKAARLRKETGNDLLRSKLDVGLSSVDYFKRGIVRPLKLLVFSPISIIFGLYIAVVYGYLYLMFTSITEVFMEYYGFSTSNVGLVFIGLGVGSLAGVLYFSVASDRSIRGLAAKAKVEAEANGTEYEGMKPEYRLPPLRWGAFLLPAGLFIYGWTAQYRTHWIFPILGMVVIGVGNLVIFMALQMYLVDAFTVYAASALAANTVVRSIAGAVLPLAGLRMYAVLGVGWGNSVLGFIAAALIPVPFLILRYGEFLRKNFEVKNL